jgi:hypothetical protein
VLGLEAGRRTNAKKQLGVTQFGALLNQQVSQGLGLACGLTHHDMVARPDVLAEIQWVCRHGFHEMLTARVNST